MSDETTDLLIERIEIRRLIRGDGSEVIQFESADAVGDPMGLAEAMSLLEYSKIQLTVEMVRWAIFEEIERADDEYEDDEDEE